MYIYVISMVCILLNIISAMCTNEVSHYQVLNEGELLPARDIGATPKKTVVQQGGGGML